MFRRLRDIFLVAFFLQVFLVSGHSAETGVNFYYFNPDSPQSNLNLLKQEMDRFFDHNQYPVTFQPFAHFLDFDKGIKQDHPDFLFLPKWYVTEYGEKLNIRPILTPVRDGSISYQKVMLTATGSLFHAERLTNQSLAMTSMGSDSEVSLREIFKSQGFAAQDINIVQVPKDSDALFALILGQVDLALVTRSNLEILWNINPQIKQNVRIVMESDPIPMPILCYVDKNGIGNGGIREFSQVFLSKKGNGMRNNLMEMLKIDGWQTITD